LYLNNILNAGLLVVTEYSYTLVLILLQDLSTPSTSGPNPPSVFVFNRGTKCTMFISQVKPSTSQSVIFNPDFFVERLRHEHPQAFADLVLSNITRLIDLPGEEFAQLTGESEAKLPSASGFLRSFNFLKRKG